MGLLGKITDYVTGKQLSLVLSEGDDLRVIGAAVDIIEKKLASSVIVLGEKEKIGRLAAQNGLSLAGVTIIDPVSSELLDSLAGRLMEIRSRDYPDLVSARAGASQRVNFGALLQESGRVDLHVSGAVETSATVIRSFYNILRINRRAGMASSFFLMESPRQHLGENGVLFFADCAVNIDPAPRQLARIAYQVGNVVQDIFGQKTRLAFLSYSTKGSGNGEQVEKIVQAGQELAELKPAFEFETELQADAALVPEVAERKAPAAKTGEKLRGRANVLIFPNLEAGNIAYKLVERFGQARALGPIMVGLNKFASDLSRGCSRQDIVDTYAVLAYYFLKSKELADQEP